MTQLVELEAKKGNKQVIEDARRIAGLPADDPYVPLDAKEVLISLSFLFFFFSFLLFESLFTLLIVIFLL